MTKAWQLICDVSRKGKIINIVKLDKIFLISMYKIYLCFKYRIREDICSSRY